ncbi:MAG: hypothetical protein ACI9VT_000833, partial [Psychroserpens sp.]
DWSGPFPQHIVNVTNIDKLPAFNNICENLGVRPTYFVDYAVADNDHAVEKMLSFTAKNNCEIGAHLHPWCNPPYFGDVGEAESHVVNLPSEQVYKKLDALMSRIKAGFGVKPKSFRTGRWGIDKNVMALLVKSGITVDSSVYPFYENEYFSCNGASSLPYWPDLTNPLNRDSQNKIYELPVTVGFNRQNFEFANKVHRAFSTPPLSWTRFNGLAWHTNLLRKTYLCPELSSSRDMLALCETVIKKGYPILHMYMHSSSMLVNQNGLLGSQQEPFEFITDALSIVVNQLKSKYSIEFCTISEAATKLNTMDTSAE